jgi:hypothetical protein
MFLSWVLVTQFFIYLYFRPLFIFSFDHYIVCSWNYDFWLGLVIFKHFFVLLIVSYFIGRMLFIMANSDYWSVQGLWCSTIFQLYRDGQFYWWGKRKKTSDLPQTLSHNVVSSTPRLSGIRSHNVSLAGVVWTESICNKTIYDSIQNWTSLFCYFSIYIHCISNMQFAIRMDAIFVSYFVNASYDAMYTIEMPWNSFLLGEVGSGQLPI